MTEAKLKTTKARRVWGGFTDANPFVVAITFDVIKANIDSLAISPGAD